MTQINDLLRSSISQHGYKLINNQEIIKNDLKGALRSFGLITTKKLLNDKKNPLTMAIYQKIKESTR